MSSLIHTLVRLPIYILVMLVGTIEAIASDRTVTLLAIGVVCIGCLTNALIAVAVFTILLAFFRAINTVSNAIGQSGMALARAISLTQTHNG